MHGKELRKEIIKTVRIILEGHGHTGSKLYSEPFDNVSESLKVEGNRLKFIHGNINNIKKTTLKQINFSLNQLGDYVAVLTRPKKGYIGLRVVKQDSDLAKRFKKSKKK